MRGPLHHAQVADRFHGVKLAKHQAGRVPPTGPRRAPRLQTELLNRQRWRSRVELANAMFEYLEIFHNRQRRQSALGMLTPIEYEMLPTESSIA